MVLEISEDVEQEKYLVFNEQLKGSDQIFTLSLVTPL